MRGWPKVVKNLFSSLATPGLRCMRCSEAATLGFKGAAAKVMT